MIRRRCQKCGKLIIEPMGRSSSPYLLVGEYPGKNETISGVPFALKSGPRDHLQSGDILHAELLRVGLNLAEFLTTNLWHHAVDHELCDEALHVDQLTKLFAGKTHVLLMGSTVTMALIGKTIDEVAGLRVSVPGYKNVRFWASPTPALAFKSPLGELRLSFQRFSDDIKMKR